MSNKLKVLATIPSGFCFGLQYVSVDLFAATRQTIEPYFFTTKWHDGVFIRLIEKWNFGHSASWLGMFSRKLDWTNLRMSLITLSRLPWLYYDYIRLIRKTKPDILFFANHHELILLMPILIFSRKKVICHMHDPSPVMFFQKLNFLLYGLRVDHFIVISEDVKKRLMLLGRADHKTSMIHNGIHLPANDHGQKRSIFNKEFSWPIDSFIVGITGQMTETKGHEDLVDAFSIAIKQNPKLRLVIGGKTLEPLYSRLVALIKERDLEDQIKFSGWMENASDFYSSIDVLVLASRHDEGYGLVVAEAMAHSKPVIITNSGGAVEIVEDGVSGFIVPKRHSESMAARMITLSIDTDLYNRFKQAGLERIRKEFSIEVAAERFSNKLHSLKMQH